MEGVENGPQISQWIKSKMWAKCNVPKENEILCCFTNGHIGQSLFEIEKQSGTTCCNSLMRESNKWLKQKCQGLAKQHNLVV